MIKKVVPLFRRDFMDWRKIKVYSELGKCRPAYASNEIARIVQQNMLSNNHTIQQLSSILELSVSDIQYMLEGKYEYTYDMLTAASKYLDIPFEDLTGIIQDVSKCSLRGDCDNENAKELFSIINFVFNEAIRQERLAS